MNDLISRQAAIDALHKTMFEFFKNDGDDDPEFITASEKMLLSVNKAISNALKQLPSVQPEQKIGRWVKYKSWYVCSECRSEMFFTGTYDESQHYCYNCGARMEE